MGVRLFGMTCGWQILPFDLLIEGMEGMVAVPIPSYLIKHPKGTVLLDTGMEIDLQSKDPTVLSTALGPLYGRIGLKYEPGEEVSSRLEAFDVDPGRIDYVINSHLHLDHCGGNELIPNARLIVQKREWEAGFSPEGQAANNYVQRHYDLGHDRMEVDGEHDLFGDGSVTCIPTYGHTPGHQSLRVKLDGGEVILTADACYMCKSLEQMKLPNPFLVSDPEQMLAHFRRFKALQDAGALLIFGHDPEQSRQLTDGPVREITANQLRMPKGSVQG